MSMSSLLLPLRRAGVRGCGRGLLFRLCSSQAAEGPGFGFPPSPPLPPPGTFGTAARGSRRQSSKREHVLATKEIAKLGREKRWQEALMIFGTVPEPDVFVQTAALTALVRSFQLHQARRLFAEMTEKNVASYNVFMSLLGKMGLDGEAAHLMEEMKQNGPSPNDMTYCALINAHGVAKDSAAAFRVLDEMVAASIRPSASTLGSAMAAAGRSADVENASRLLERLEQEFGVKPDVGHYTSLISAHARSGDDQGARASLDQMKERGLRPGVVTYTSLLAGLSGPGALGRAEAIFAEMKREQLFPDTLAYNAFLGAAAAGRDAKRFWEVLEEMDGAGVARNDQTEQKVREMESLSSIEELPLPPAAQQEDAPLPPGWRETLDPASGRCYYWLETDPAGSTTWVRPSSPS